MEKVSAQLVTIMEDHLRVGGFNTMGVLTQGKEARELYSLVLNTSHGTLIQEALKLSPRTLLFIQCLSKVCHVFRSTQF